MAETLRLYHSGYAEIRDPDVHYGRKNADFRQGFYTTDDLDFALRWAPERKASSVIVNEYILELSGLFTSGALSAAQSVELLSCMPVRLQVVLKTGRAARNLRWISSRTLSSAELAAVREAARADEKAFEQALGEKLGRMEL